MDKKVFEKILRIAEEFYGSEYDPEQMPVTQESADKLLSISPDTTQVKLDDNGNPIAWSIVVPTSVDVMNKFLSKTITEKDLLDLATEEKKFEALYLCSVFVIPEERRKGYAKELIRESVEKFSHGQKIPLYCWVYSEEGRKLANVLSQEFGRTILER